ncbi:MAG: hypothetical protein JWN34_6334 [Bryobacterales bacterium]|nr:hypothetical protein [Bryobacterales bacterium]
MQLMQNRRKSGGQWPVSDNALRSRRYKSTLEAWLRSAVECDITAGQRISGIQAIHAGKTCEGRVIMHQMQ